LVLIGVVGMQLAVDPDSPVSKVLPFYGPQELIYASLVGEAAVAGPLALTVLYGFALMIAARLFVARRVGVTRHPGMA